MLTHREGKLLRAVQRILPQLLERIIVRRRITVRHHLDTVVAV